jgi:hypothetical protein
MFYSKLYIVILVYLLDFFWYFSVPEDLWLNIVFYEYFMNFVYYFNFSAYLKFCNSSYRAMKLWICELHCYCVIKHYNWWMNGQFLFLHILLLWNVKSWTEVSNYVVWYGVYFITWWTRCNIIFELLLHTGGWIWSCRWWKQTRKASN